MFEGESFDDMQPQVLVEPDRMSSLLQDAFAFIKDDLSKTSELSKATLFRWRPEDEHLDAIAAVGTQNLVELAQSIATESSFAYPRSAALKRQAIIGNVGDGSWPKVLKDYASDIGINSVLSVPIVLAGEVVGVINFFFDQPVTGEGGQLSNLRALGRIIAQAVSSNLVLRLKGERQARHIRSLAHEASNLLKAVEQVAELLLYDEQVKIPTEITQLVYHMISNLKDAVLLLKNVASAERINMGDFKVALRRHEISDILRRAIMKRSVLFEKAYDVKIKLEGFPTGSYGLIDPFLLQRAVENVLVNACRYSPPGETITVSAVQEESLYIISVADKGPGIPEKFSENVFEEFFTIPSGSIIPTSGQEPSGSGLGLFIAREILKKHNGFINVDKTICSGCKIIISLPLVREENGNGDALNPKRHS
jgi:signal transduction histidine kinase